MRRPPPTAATLLAAALALAAPAAAVAQALPGIALERALARSLGVGVGDTVTVGTAPGTGRAMRVEAVYAPPPDPVSLIRRERRVRLHLPDLAALLGAPDRVDRLGVRVRGAATPESVAARLNAAAFGYHAWDARAIAARSSRTFEVVSRFHRAIGVITIVASAVFLLCIMLLKVEERRLDAAVMRFIGVRRRTIFGALLLEATVVAAVGAALGVAFAWVAGAATNLFYQRFFDTSVVFSLVTREIVAFGAALSLGLGVAAGALAALRLVRTPPMTLWGRG